jgi:drug/metabolite transporter (DMT)-like permease
MKKKWLFYALITTITWGIWGAFSEIPEKNGFPSTLTYVVWAISMIPCALVALKKIHFKLDVRKKSVFLGMGVGILGAGGQLILFQALKEGPAYIIFPIISIAPILTVILSSIFLRERVKTPGIIGIIFAFVSIICFSISSNEGASSEGYLWLILALIVFACWGTQAFIMKVANNYSPDAESIFVYMAISGLLFIPVAIGMTDFSIPMNWGWNGPYLSFMIQILNAIGALFLVYAMRYGKAIVVSPLADAVAPVITVLISLLIYQQMPPTIQLIGIISALSSIFILSRE